MADAPPKATVVEDLGSNTQDLVKFISTLEDEFTKDGRVLEITDDDAADVLMVGQVVEMLKRKGVLGPGRGQGLPDYGAFRHPSGRAMEDAAHFHLLSDPAIICPSMSFP